MTNKKITPKELHERLQSGEKVLLLDVRGEEKYNEFHIKESRNLPKNVIFQLEEKEDARLSLPKDQEIIVTCTTGNSASKCAAILNTHDYHVTVLDGGLTAWKAYMNLLED